MALNVFGSAPASLTAFNETMSGGDDFRLAENIGAHLIITVTGPKEVSTSFGVKTAIEASKVVALGATPADAKVYTDVLIFNAAPVDQLKGSAGQSVIVTVDTYETKQGGKAPRFTAPTAEVVTSAEAYYAAAS